MSLDDSQISSRRRTLYHASWALVAYTVLIVVWGAWVRISGSGDGCGDHWPLCHGMAVPIGAGEKTWIEVSHRYSTALFGMFVVVQLVATRWSLPAPHPAHRWVWITFGFTVSEALIGMLLVKQGLVNQDTSFWRLLIMPLHLVNTSLLLTSEVISAESIRFCHPRTLVTSSTGRWKIPVITVGILLLLTSGAIAALGSHLMPSDSLLQGLHADFQENSHPAVRLRLLHPFLGLALPVGLVLLLRYGPEKKGTSHITNSAQRDLVVGLFVAAAIGVITLGLLAPVWLKLTHLTVANMLVILAARYGYHSFFCPRELPSTKTSDA